MITATIGRVNCGYLRRCPGASSCFGYLAHSVRVSCLVPTLQVSDSARIESNVPSTSRPCEHLTAVHWVL